MSTVFHKKVFCNLWKIGLVLGIDFGYVFSQFILMTPSDRFPTLQIIFVALPFIGI